MPLTSIRMITDSKTTAASKAPIKYFTQSGVVGSGDGVSVEETGSSGDDGCSSVEETGSSGDGGCCLVVKALTALQAL